MASQHDPLEQLIHRELKRLPEVPAPATLVHRVMLAAHRQAEQPWWRQSWIAWPAWFRILFVLGTAALACGLVAGLAHLWGHFTLPDIQSELADHLSFLRPFWCLVVALFTALARVMSLVKPVWFYGAAILAGALYIASVGLGTLCYRVAANKV